MICILYLQLCRFDNLTIQCKIHQDLSLQDSLLLPLTNLFMSKLAEIAEILQNISTFKYYAISMLFWVKYQMKKPLTLHVLSEVLSHTKTRAPGYCNKKSVQ